ncbi:hypothetical protein KC669_05105 [Candidatus Dojkabacteria bacterium]|uniref:Uncharacterized protein n=1 Tax=Candidatus Dojkabacteria bacterium TaxID=2099670 RepID=A0A955LBU0_9BACT|nr:hypothetical protein [Candidatus Dojkabacteria bacterium]
MNIENLQPENTYNCHRILLDLGSESPPENLLQPPEPIELEYHPKTPYILVRATAFQWIDQIRSELTRLDIEVSEEIKIPQFETFLRHLYPVNPSNENSYLWLHLSRTFLGKELANLGYVFILDKSHLNNYNEISDAKRKIRSYLGITPFRLFYQNRVIDTDLHHIHAPDEGNIEYEYSLLKSYLSVISNNE